MKHFLKYRSFSSNLNSKAYWNDSLEAMGDFWRDDHYRCILDLFPADEKFTLLDVGCALGDGCELLKRHFPQAEITGIDFSGVGIEKAKRRGGSVKYVVHDVLKDPVPGDYDYITIVETLEHFNEPYPVVDKLLKHVRKKLIVSVPYSDKTRSLRGVDYHKFQFSDDSFIGYNHKIVRITDFVESTGGKCIVYEITP